MVFYKFRGQKDFKLLCRPSPNVVYGSESYIKPVAVVQILTDASTLDKCSVKVRCDNCSQEQFTRVNSKISSNGWRWAFSMCIAGCLPFLLLLCIPGFKEYSHYCSSCASSMGVYSPKMGGAQRCLVVLLSLLSIAVHIVLILLLIKFLTSGNFFINSF